MSGILGFVADCAQTVQIDPLRRALRSLEQRGRDDRSILLFNNSGPSSLILDEASERQHSSFRNAQALNDLATAMLACCHSHGEDRSSARRQSFESADGRVFLACDGVVDNGPELSRELRNLARDVQSKSRLEILSAALEQWGPDCLARVSGSFAFAVVDFHRRTLILARDAFGTRPLYYSRPSGTG